MSSTSEVSEETFATPISPPEEQQEKETPVHQMQSLIQSSADLTFPLEDSWSFWFFKNDRQCEWKDNLIKITTVATVESFWSVYNHLQVASRIGQGCDYLLFKTHIVSPPPTDSTPTLNLCLATDVGRRLQSVWWSLVDQSEQGSASGGVGQILDVHRRESRPTAIPSLTCLF